MVKLAIKTGAKGYIVKPFQAPKVIEEVKNVLAT
jgi:two-component system chemotaxis response regulator CheY